MKSILRKAERKDERQILELVAEVLKDFGLSIDPEGIDKDLSDLDKYYFNNNGWFSVITNDEDTIIGCCGVFKTDATSCELRKMYVLNNYQGQGLGKMLLESSLEKAKGLGYKEMTLESNFLLYKANDMYKKVGFVQYQPGNLCGRCDYAMKKQLQ
ncbi:unnamed protein product [Didymodactylos carnosus]|uniref:N-acetyltransferase domain-containing protein n=1 Tax=Didymodactylos carnosus TaxID=1234261 RepID=A0A815D6Q6_9BILA|nr:unnamed protein product [Didymodactylos carnosus]CAF1289516.1 unnamed protein product [Didymodactylos carnosus]CAF3983102.1 unnamed protein product [Didymodactylos carnosus]CAF4094161.1 unnamed protein product [Didymodactylos carnosus]